jgi:hypothetical protein
VCLRECFNRHYCECQVIWYCSSDCQSHDRLVHEPACHTHMREAHPTNLSLVTMTFLKQGRVDTLDDLRDILFFQSPHIAPMFKTMVRAMHRVRILLNTGPSHPIPKRLVDRAVLWFGGTRSLRDLKEEAMKYMFPLKPMGRPWTEVYHAMELTTASDLSVKLLAMTTLTPQDVVELYSTLIVPWLATLNDLRLAIPPRLPPTAIKSKVPSLEEAQELGAWLVMEENALQYWLLFIQHSGQAFMSLLVSKINHYQPPASLKWPSFITDPTILLKHYPDLLGAYERYTPSNALTDLNIVRADLYQRFDHSRKVIQNRNWLTAYLLMAPLHDPVIPGGLEQQSLMSASQLRSQRQSHYIYQLAIITDNAILFRLHGAPRHSAETAALLVYAVSRGATNVLECWESEFRFSFNKTLELLGNCPIRQKPDPWSMLFFYAVAFGQVHVYAWISAKQPDMTFEHLIPLQFRVQFIRGVRAANADLAFERYRLESHLRYSNLNVFRQFHLSITMALLCVEYQPLDQNNTTSLWKQLLEALEPYEVSNTMLVSPFTELGCELLDSMTEREVLFLLNLMKSAPFKFRLELINPSKNSSDTHGLHYWEGVKRERLFSISLMATAPVVPSLTSDKALLMHQGVQGLFEQTVLDKLYFALVAQNSEEFQLWCALALVDKEVYFQKPIEWSESNVLACTFSWIWYYCRYAYEEYHWLFARGLANELLARRARVHLIERQLLPFPIGSSVSSPSPALLPRETNVQTLLRQQRQIDLGKATWAYTTYVAALSRTERLKSAAKLLADPGTTAEDIDGFLETHPMTPRASDHYANSRVWRAIKSRWRARLHRIAGSSSGNSSSSGSDTAGTSSDNNKDDEETTAITTRTRTQAQERLERLVQQHEHQTLREAVHEFEEQGDESLPQ